MRRHPLAVRTSLLAALVVVAGCGGRHVPSPFDPQGASTLQITIDNQNFDQVRVYAVTVRGPRSLGQVGGRASGTFTIEWRQLDEIRFRLEFLAAEEYETDRINASPGDRIEVYISENPNNTTIRRR